MLAQKQIKDKKLGAHLTDLTAHHRSTAALAYEHDHLLLPQDNAGLIEPENELERTWRVRQEEIKGSVGIGAATKAFDLDLPTYGPYTIDYTSNGRCAPRLLFRFAV
jgi:U3 small nucleolar RNA-associated protein 7